MHVAVSWSRAHGGLWPAQAACTGAVAPQHCRFSHALLHAYKAPYTLELCRYRTESEGFLRGFLVYLRKWLRSRRRRIRDVHTMGHTHRWVTSSDNGYIFGRAYTCGYFAQIALSPLGYHFIMAGEADGSPASPPATVIFACIHNAGGAQHEFCCPETRRRSAILALYQLPCGQ